MQPSPETVDLFDDILLLAEGRVVYHGPTQEAMPFFESLGFACPPISGLADFLQGVTTPTDQQASAVGGEAPPAGAPPPAAQAGAFRAGWCSRDTFGLGDPKAPWTAAGGVCQAGLRPAFARRGTGQASREATPISPPPTLPRALLRRRRVLRPLLSLHCPSRQTRSRT